MKYEDINLTLLDTHISGDSKCVLYYDNHLKDYIIKQFDNNKHYKEMDILGESEFSSFNWMECYNQFSSVLKDHKKTLSQRTIIIGSNDLKLNGYKMLKTISIDPAIIAFLKDNKVNVSNFIQTAILEKLEKDNL